MYDPFDYEETGEFGRYGEDFSDPRQFCRHGTFVGNPYGPDYMCGWCESGEEPPPPPTFRAQVFVNGELNHEQNGYSRAEVWNAPNRLPSLIRQICYEKPDNPLSTVLQERRVEGWVTVDRI